MHLPSPALFPAILTRELRAASRRSGTYWLRVVVVAVALAALFLQFTAGRLASALVPGGRAPLPGAYLFALLHTVLSVGLLLAAPLFAADCIARERRDGTLGLLALTPLRPFEIVLGKAAAQIIRLLSLWIACLPVLLIPVLMGGVGAVDIQYALGIEGMIVLGGLAAGLIATSFCRQWSRSAGLALAITLVGGQIITLGAAFLIIAAARVQAPAGLSSDLAGQSVWMISMASWFSATGLYGPGFGTLLSGFPPWVSVTTGQCLLGGIAITALFFGLSILVAGWCVGNSLRPDGRTVFRRQSSTAKAAVRFARPRAERRRQRWLADNPARWLCAASGSNRWGPWGWLILVALGWFFFPTWTGNSSGDRSLTYFIPAALAFPLAMTAAASFRRELEEGTLELLLVTPLPAGQLIWARILEQWSLFGPAALLQIILSVLLVPIDDTNAPLRAVQWAGLTSLLTLPAIGIRYAVRRLHPLSGFFWSLLTILILPFLLGLATLASSDSENPATSFMTGFGLTQAGLSLVWGWLAARDLETRWYLFRPFQRRAR
jgi:ABC-type transport system involved in multi-copper enzyme maturation permease subunit